MTERDRLDKTRSTSPLYAAPDAVIIDTTDKPIEAVVKEVLEVIETKSHPSPEHPPSRA
jgi:cytidylate kinase